MWDGLLRVWDAITSTISNLNVLDAIDMLLLAVLIYWLLRVAKQTRAMSVLKGISVMFALSQLAAIIGLQAVGSVLNYILSAGVVVVVIVFQPEIRRALEKLGKGRYFSKAGAILQPERSEDTSKTGEQMLLALLNMAKNKVGALVVVQGEQPLDEIQKTGTVLDAHISQPLLENLFVEGSPLHDGAVIVRGNRIMAAGCFLPLTDQKLHQTLGTRHRAAVGMSEEYDVQVYVVSEETGTISRAVDGRLSRNLDLKDLSAMLETRFGKTNTGTSLIELFRRRVRLDK